MIADGVTDHFDVSENVSDADHCDEDWEQSWPQPAVGHVGKCGENQDNIAHPNTISNYGDIAQWHGIYDPGKGAIVIGKRDVIINALVVSDSMKWKDQQHRQDDPADVSENDDTTVADDAVTKLIVSSIVGHHTQTQL